VKVVLTALNMIVTVFWGGGGGGSSSNRIEVYEMMLCS
jgi:hypothetical protein